MERAERSMEELVGDKWGTGKQRCNRVLVSRKDKWQKQRAIYKRQEQLSCIIAKSCCD